MAVADNDTLTGLRWTLWTLAVVAMILGGIGLLLEWKKWQHWDKVIAVSFMFAVMLVLFSVDYDFVVS